MYQRTFIAVLFLVGLAWVGASEAQARVRYRGYAVRRPVVAPVRRGVARAALPPYGVRRYVVARPYVRTYAPYPAYIGPVYRPGVSVSVGF